MAGGTFKASQPKVRPGVYVNIKNGRQPSATAPTTGVAAVPLIGYDWGPRGTFIEVSAESPDAHLAEFGRSVYDDNDNMVILQLMLLGASTVYVYIPDGGKAASKEITVGSSTMTVTALYKGSLGNSIKIVSVANPLGGYDVSVVLDGSEVELFEGITDIGELADQSEYVSFSGTGSMAAFASASLENGEDDTTVSNAAITAFLDKAEKIRFNCMCFPTEDSALQAALLTKIKYIRESIGWKCQAVAPNFAADYEGIINLVNSFDYDEKELTVAQACGWLAGATAGADYVTTLTYTTVPDATMVVGELTNEESIAAIKAGKAFFSLDDSGNVILETDINSRVTLTDETPQDIMKNRPLRVYDTFANQLLVTFVPGKYDNDEDGWGVMEGLGRAILQGYEDDGAIQNVDLEADFLVDTGQSTGDSTYITVGIQTVDSAEKYYFSAVAR